ncbi:MAG: potassium transporter TrkG [Bacteroidales bacterium]
MISYDKIILYHRKIVQPYINLFGRVLDIFTNFIAILFVLGLMYHYGFDLSDYGIKNIETIYNVAWVVFLINITYFFFTGFKKVKKKYKILIVVLGGLLYITLLPYIFFRPLGDGFMSIFWDILHGNFYRLTLFTLFAFLNISNGVIRLLGKRTNPALILAGSFFIIILVGMGLLILPRSTVAGISWVNALFVSTSAVCVTGLTPVDVSTTFTIEGQIIIALLIQIGGLGVMTLTSFFAVFFMGNTSLYNQIALKDIISSDSISSLISTLVYILVFTLVIEGVGMLFIWWSIHGTLGMSINEELFFSAFHAISAFCNAGFSTLSGNLGNPMLLSNHNMLYISISILIILGGIGFPILVNFKDIIFRKRTYRLLNLNTRIVLFTTLVLVVGGTVLIAIFEWNRSFMGMGADSKIVQSFFNAVCPRTAGFTSVDLTAMSLQTLLIYILLMWIGGAAQSTAGGIKVNAFAVAILNLKTVLKGRHRVETFGREISTDSIRRSNATVLLSLVVLFLFIFTLSIIEPQISLFKIVFECVSALSTVGSSLNATQLFSDNGKLIIALLMFVGRIGLMTLMLGIIKPAKNTKYRYPSDSIIIN